MWDVTPPGSILDELELIYVVLKMVKSSLILIFI